METRTLKEQDVFPDAAVLEKALGKTYAAFNDLMNKVTGLGLIPQWNYYKDGKAWLCKVQYKKKTVFWLSVWDKYFKTAFYFTEKNSAGIHDLDIDKDLKKDFNSRKQAGKLIPLVINIHKKEQLKDVLKVAEYKRSLK